MVVSNVVGAMIGSAIGGAVVGAIGGAVADSSRSHPVLKAAFVVGALNAVMTGIYVAAREDQRALDTGTVHGLGEPRWL